MGRLAYEKKNPDTMIELLTSFLPMLLEGAPVLLNLIKSLDTNAQSKLESQDLVNLLSQFTSIYPELGEILKMGGEKDG